MVGLGMMPLLLFILSHGFPGLENAVPYKGIIAALVLTLVPCGVGILINHHKPKYSQIVKKVRLLTPRYASSVADILTCYNRKSTGVINNINGSCIPIRWGDFQGDGRET